jgi:RNA polymerase sigma factor (sigma-70 family)
MKMSIKNEKLQKIPVLVEKQPPQGSSLVEEDRSIENEAEKWWNEARYRSNKEMVLSPKFQEALWIYARDNPVIPWLTVVEGLYFIYLPNIERFCREHLLRRGCLSNERDEEVEKILQEVFYELSMKDRRKDETGKPIDKIISYLIIITKNLCVNMLKKKNKEKKLYEKLYKETVERNSNGNYKTNEQHKQPIQNEENEQINQLIPQDNKIELLERFILTERNKKMCNCFHLTHIVGMTLKQIGEIEGISFQMVNKYNNKFKKRHAKQIRSILGYDIEDEL